MTQFVYLGPVLPPEHTGQATSLLVFSPSHPFKINKQKIYKVVFQNNHVKTLPYVATLNYQLWMEDVNIDSFKKYMLWS